MFQRQKIGFTLIELLFMSAVFMWQILVCPQSAYSENFKCYYTLPTVLVFPETSKKQTISVTRFINEKVHNSVYENVISESAKGSNMQKAVILSARGEAEPIQFVIETRGKSLNDVKLMCTDLHCRGIKLSASNIDIRIVGYTHFKGKLWPDPLFEQKSSGIDISKNSRQAWWITVNVSKEQSAGIYKGKLKIISGKDEIKSVPFSVEIANFAFPQPLPMGVSIGLGIDAPALQMALERHFYPHHHVVGIARPTFKIDSSGKIILDFSKFDKKVQKLREQYGMKYIGLGYIMGDGAGAPYWKNSLYPWAIDENGKRVKICIDPRKDEKSKMRFRSVMQQYVRHLRQKGWLGDSFIYLWDEPHKLELIKLANEFGGYFKWASPQLPLMVTGYIKNCDIVCSLVNHCSDSAVAKCKKEGKRYWIYTCGSLQDPSLTVGKPALDSRIFGWVGFRYYAENFLYWGLTINYRKTKLVDKIVFEKTPGNGDGALFYALSGKNVSVIPSIRSENLRDGVEDAIVLNMAERAGKRNIRRIVKKLIPDQHHYNANPTKYVEIRSRIYEELGSE